MTMLNLRQDSLHRLLMVSYMDYMIPHFLQALPDLLRW